MSKSPRRRVCSLCEEEFPFDDERSLYENICDRCAQAKYPLAYSVRERLRDVNCWSAEACREVFGPAHDGCLPESAQTDDVMVDVLGMFKAIGHSLARVAGLKEREYIVLVEPSYEDTTWWAIIQPPLGAYLPIPAWQSRLLFFSYNKAWGLGLHDSEDELEEELMNWKREIQEGLERRSLADAIVERVEKMGIQTLHLAHSKTGSARTCAH